MKSLARNIEEFGNPAAYRENRLYHIFSDQGKEDLYYHLVLYGIRQDEYDDVPLEPKYRGLLSRVIKHQQKRIKRISGFIHSIKVPGLWLDMGCGLGQFMNQIIQLKGNYVVGSDVSFHALRKAHSLLSQVNCSKSYHLVNQDSLGLPFKDNSFDYILSADVLEHVGYNNQNEIVSELYRVLKKKGQVIIHTPNLNRVIVTTFLKRIYYLFKGINPLQIRHSFPKSHTSLATAKRLKKICQSVGFNTTVYQQIDWKLYNLHKWAFLGLDRLFSRSFILVLSKKINY